MVTDLKRTVKKIRLKENKQNKFNSSKKSLFFSLLPQQGGSCYITLAGLKFALVLTLPARCWDYRYVPLT